MAPGARARRAGRTPTFSRVRGRRRSSRARSTTARTHSPTGTTVTVDGDRPLHGPRRGGPRPRRPPTTAPVELGSALHPAVDGFVTGVRFYKGPANTGTHVGVALGCRGQPLASVTFGGRDGDRMADRAVPRPGRGARGHAYTVSYTAPQGITRRRSCYWPYKARQSAPLNVARASGGAPGVYGHPGRVPTATGTTPTTSSTFSSRSPTPRRCASRRGRRSRDIQHRPTPRSPRPSRGPPTPRRRLTRDGRQRHGGRRGRLVRRRERTARFAPTGTAGLHHLYGDVHGERPHRRRPGHRGRGPSPRRQRICPRTVPVLAVPRETGPICLARDTARSRWASDSRSSSPGKITAIKFFKGTGNSGSHSARSGRPAGRSSPRRPSRTSRRRGGRRRPSPPVGAARAQTYVASYLAPTGGYAVIAGHLSCGYSRGPLTVPANGGAYTYAGGFPSTGDVVPSYAVDVVFVPAAPAPVLCRRSPARGSAGVDRDTAVSGGLQRRDRPRLPGVRSPRGGAVPARGRCPPTRRTRHLHSGGAVPGGRGVVSR